MSYLRKSIFFQMGYEYLESPLCFVDVGARGEPSQPFADMQKKMPKLIRIISFEPDHSASLLINKTIGGEVINKAAWKEETELTLFVTSDNSASSVFKPSESTAAQFDSLHFNARNVIRTEKISAIALDDALRDIEDIGGSFLKCDTQGSEFEVVVGASDFLKTRCVGLTMECWTQPVYEGLSTVDEVISLVRSLDFEIFDFQISAAWNRNLDGLSLIRKKQVVGIDFLAFKKIDSFYMTEPSAEESMRFVLLADLWGFPDLSLQILKHKSCKIDQTTRTKLVESIFKLRKSRRFENKHFIFHRDLIRSKFKIRPRFPFIH